MRILASLLLALALACGGSRRDQTAAPAAPGVMTQNLYLGAPLDPLFAPASIADVPAAVGSLWRTVQASDPPARMARVADEIADRGPALVGLQEAALFRTVSALTPGAPETVAFDFVALLLAELQARGLAYRVAATSTNFDERLPDDTGLLVHFTDRDVVLARDDVATSDPRDGRFVTQLSLALPGVGTLAIPRGWCSVSADAGGGPLRFANAHLEAASRPVQEAQAQELVQVLAGETGRVVLVGDMNSPADGSESRSYALLRGAGFADAWQETHPADPGLTCCFPGDLRTVAPLVSRIDLVLPRGAVDATAAEVVGEEAADRTGSGLWPSDHAGVAAGLRVR
jgi:hypothetical protein